MFTKLKRNLDIEIIGVKHLNFTDPYNCNLMSLNGLNNKNHTLYNYSYYTRYPIFKIEIRKNIKKYILHVPKIRPNKKYQIYFQIKSR